MNLIASISGFLSNCLDLFPKYGQCRICSNRFCQFLICPDGHSQFRVQFVEHDRSHFVFICNHSQPLVFFPVFMPLYPTDGKKNEKHERTAYASPCVRVLVPAIGNFVPQQPCCVYRLVGTDCLPQFRYKALLWLRLFRKQPVFLHVVCQHFQYLVKLFLGRGNAAFAPVLFGGFKIRL